jgi:hypothetical protein
MFKQKSKIPNTIRRVLLLAILAVVTVASFSVFFGRSNHAAAATSSTINFQARLLTAAGNVVPDGQYNVEFKLYNASSSSGSSQGSCSGDSACVWTETRVTANKVRTVNGYLTVNLGSVTAFGAINWDQDLWLTMNIGGTGTASWDGEMTPRLKLTAVPYAFTAGKLVGGTGANTTTLNTGTPSGTNTISLPAESGTLCIQNSANCGFALSTGSGNYIQNTTSLQNANYYVRAASSGSVAGVLQANASGTGDILDLRNGSGTLVGSFSSTGAFLLQPSADTTSSFNMKTSTGNNMFTIDTQNSRVGIGLGSTNLPSLNAGGLQINGALKLSGGATQQDLYVTPNGGTVSSMINVVNFDPGASGQIIAMGLPSTANATSRAISLLDARTVSHQPTIAVFSPNQNNVFGFSWEGSNTDSYVKSSGTGSIFLQANGTDSVSASSTAVNLLQNTSVAAGKTLTVQGTALFKNSANANLAFEVQDSSANPVFRVDTSARKVAIGAYSQTAADNITGQLQVLPTANNRVGINITSPASYSANYLEAIDSGGTFIFRVQSNGNVQTSGGVFTSNTQSAASTNSNSFTMGSGAVSGATSNSGVTTLSSGNSTTSGNTGNVTVASGNATSGNSGNVTIDAGTASGTKGTVFVGTTNAAAVNIGHSGINTSITGNLVQDTGTFSLTGSSSSSISTTSGTLTLQSVDANNNIVINGGSTSMTLNTGSSGTITVGSSGTTTVNVGANTNNARTINIGFGTNITSQAQTINLGSTTGAGVTTIRSGSGNTFLTSTASTIVRQSGTATTTAFQVQNVAGTQTYFNVDSFNGRVGIGNAAPAYVLDVTGDVNTSTVYRIGGTQICASTGCTASSASAILNQSGSTQAANFKIQSATDINTATILANGSQTADVFQIQSSTGSPVAGIRPSGAIWSAPITNPVTDVPASARLFVQASAASSNAAVFRASALGTGVSSDGSILRLQNKDGTADTFTVGGDGAVTSKTLTNSTAAVSIQNSVGGPALNVDNTNANLISNPNMEGGTTGWAVKGASAISQQTTFAYDGNNSLRVVTTAAANDGAKFNFSLLASTQYTFSVFVRASADFATLQIGYSSDGTNDTSCATAQTAKNANWMRLTCTFTTGAVSGTRYVYVKQTDAAIHTFYIDGAQLETAASASLYRDGKIAVGGSLLINGGQAAASASQAALQVNALQGGGGLKVYGSGDNNIFQDAMNVYTADGLTALLSVSDSVRVTTIQGGNAFFNTPALKVVTTDGGASAIDIWGTSGQTGDILRLYDNSTSNKKMFSIAAAGAATFQNATDSDSAFMVNESGGTAVLRVDTTNQKVAIGLSSGTIPSKLYVSTGSTVALRAKQTGSSDVFQLANATSDLFNVSTTGAVNVKTTTNDTNALRIQNSAAASVFSVDTSAAQVNVGSTAQSTQLNMTGEISWGASLATPQGFEGATFVPTSPGTWSTGGNGNWTRTTSLAQSGAASAVTANVADSQTTWLDLNYTFTVDGTFSFYWKVSSEAGWDYLNFCYDNDSCTRTTGFDQQISGEVGWVKVSKAVTAGAHSFRWLYAKDGGDDGGSDLGWVDNVQFNGGGSAGVMRAGTLSFIASDTISFQTTNNANALTVDSNGRVGMNTSTPTEALTVVGNFNVADATTPTKQYRFRTSGGSLDFEGSGANLYLSAWSNADFTGTQYTALILYNSQSRMDVKANYTYFTPTADGTSVVDVNVVASGAQTFMQFAQNGTVTGSITVNATGSVLYNAFTGAHYAWSDEPIDDGMVVSMTGNNRRRNPNDFATEPYYGVKKTTEANDSSVLGSFSNGEPGDWSYEMPDYVMAAGNGYMWITDEGGDIKPGDELITSGISGYAMKDTGQFAESHIIARASDIVDWTNETQIVNGHKVKKVSVLFTQYSKLNAAGLAMGLTSGGLVSNDITFNGLAFFNKAVQFKSDVTFEGLIKVSDNTAGTVKIPAGQTSAAVTFSKAYGNPPKVTTGISEFVDVVVDNKSNNGFTVRIPSPRASDTFVDWTAFETP